MRTKRIEAIESAMEVSKKKRQEKTRLRMGKQREIEKQEGRENTIGINVATTVIKRAVKEGTKKGSKKGEDKSERKC